MDSRHLHRTAQAAALCLLFAVCCLLCLAPVQAASNITAVWANDGGDKVTQDELRATHHTENVTGKVINRTWNGHSITLFGAHNEVISFNLILEAANVAASGVSVSFDTLVGPDGATIHSTAARGNDIFNWVGRSIELFYVRYLQIKGLSYFGYNSYDERHVPKRFQRPWTGNGVAQGGWTNRPDHDKFYPDILVPLELVPTFNITAGNNQGIWGDVYIPKTVSSGIYRGNILVSENGVITLTIPVQLVVYNFALPDVPSAKTMMDFAAGDVMHRYVTTGYVGPSSPEGKRVRDISNRYYALFHRHKMTLIGDDDCAIEDHPCLTGMPRLDGSAFTPSNGYDGPGVGVPVGVFGIGIYGTWSWKYGVTESIMRQHTDAWVSWFDQNSPQTEYFLYLEDEPPAADTPQVEQWAQWMANNPGPGGRLMSLATHNPRLARVDMPTVDVPVMPADFGPTQTTQDAVNFYLNTPGRKFWAYNDERPATGITTTEEDGVGPRELSWAHYKMNVQRWFYWDVNIDGTQNLFQQAMTFGYATGIDPTMGEWGYQHSNGDGLLVYPGTDINNPSDSYGVDGPFASIRLKEIRRGLQDIDYITLASAVNPAAVRAIVNRMVPKAMWEYGVTNPSDPTYIISDISWSVDPDDWESARSQLAAMAASAVPAPTVVYQPLRPRIYPNPWKASLDKGAPFITFDQLTPACEIKIFTTSGHVVRRLPKVDSSIVWDLTNDTGEKVASGIYFYVMTDGQGNKAKGKIAIIK